MGHIINYGVVNKKDDVLPAAREYAFYNTDREENPGGDYDSSQMHFDSDHLFESKDEAEEYIDRVTGNKFYYDLAVRFIDRSSIKPTAEETRLRKKAETVFVRVQNAEKKGQDDITNRKSAFLTCPKCGSSLKVSYLHGHNCPVCRGELMSKTNLDLIAKYKKDYNDVTKAVKEAEKKRRGKGTVKWLFKVEVHC